LVNCAASQAAAVAVISARERGSVDVTGSVKGDVTRGQTAGAEAKAKEDSFRPQAGCGPANASRRPQAENSAAATTIGSAVEGAMRTKDNSGYRTQAIATIELMQRRQHPARAGVGQLKDRAATKSLALAPCVSAICGRAIEISRAINGQTRLRIRSFGAGKAVDDGEGLGLSRKTQHKRNGERGDCRTQTCVEITPRKSLQHRRSSSMT